MIVLCAGAYSSGSTWIFNVVRKLVATTDKKAFSMYSPSAGYMLSQVPPDTEIVVVKSHTVDRDFWSMAHLADVRIIRSQRDPRDAIASLMDRFGLWYHNAFVKLEQSLASLSTIPDNGHLLDLRYESGFTREVSAVLRIAEFLDIELTEEQAADIFQSLKPEQVVQTIQAIQQAFEQDKPVDTFDIGTHWQGAHVRTGESGTWSALLDERLASTVVDAMWPLLEPDGWHREPIRWSGLLFYDADQQRPSEAGKLRLPGAGEHMLYGPDLFLPSGRWQAVLDIRAARAGYDANAMLEVFAGGSANRIIALRAVTIAANGDDHVAIEFDHVDERVPLAIRLLDVPGNKAREVFFQGATLNYLGESQVAMLSDALPILTS